MEMAQAGDLGHTPQERPGPPGFVKTPELGRPPRQNGRARWQKPDRPSKQERTGMSPFKGAHGIQPSAWAILFIVFFSCCFFFLFFLSQSNGRRTGVFRANDRSGPTQRHR